MAIAQQQYTHIWMRRLCRHGVFATHPFFIKMQFHSPKNRLKDYTFSFHSITQTSAQKVTAAAAECVFKKVKPCSLDVPSQDVRALAAAAVCQIRLQLSISNVLADYRVLLLLLPFGFCVVALATSVSFNKTVVWNLFECKFLAKALFSTSTSCTLHFAILLFKIIYI